MLIAGMALSVVIPFSLQQVDSAKARSEKEKVVILLERAKDMVLFRSSQTSLVFSGRQIRISALGEDKLLNLQHISFPQETEVAVGLVGVDKDVNLAAIINGQNWVLKVNHEKAEWTYVN